MVACNLTFEDAAAFVLMSRSSYEAMDRFQMFTDLLEIDTPAEMKSFGRACGIRVHCVDVPGEALEDPAHPLHFLTKGLPEP